MTKIETITFDYEHCGECSNALYSPTKKSHHRHECDKTRKEIPDLWGEIPDFCPLPEKDGK